MAANQTEAEFQLSAEQEYEFDLRGYIVLSKHYSAEAVSNFHLGINELQDIAINFETYHEIGVASYALAPAMSDPDHPVWRGEHRPDRQPKGETGGIGRVDHALCGTDKFDAIVRDSILKAIHTTLAGGPVFISATYYIEKMGPSIGGGLHNGGFPRDRDIHYAYDHTRRNFACSSTKTVVILSDMTRLENGPFAAIPGSHKANFACPFDMSDASNNPMAVPVLAAPGDVIVFSEGMTHNAYPVTNNSIRRSVFFNYMPAISRNNLPNQRMSIYPDHVVERLRDQSDILTCPGYI